MNEETKYDFLFIGSGMSSLVCALLLVREGKSVCILEKNHQIGGSLQVFSRDKTIFDTGVHYVGGLSEGENLNRFFRHLGIFDKLNIEPLDSNCYDEIIMPDGKSYCHATGYENFIETLSQAFPGEEENIRKFCQKIRQTCELFPLYNIREADDSAYFLQPEKLEESAWDVLQSITTNQRLISVLSGSVPLFAGEKNATPFYVMALVLNSYITGSYRFTNGGSQIAIALTRELHRYGVVIEKHQQAVSADFDETGKIEAIRTKHGNVYNASVFVSNLHPATTIRIIGKDAFRPAFRKRIASLRNTRSAFVVYLSFKAGEFPYYNRNKYLYFKEDVWETISDSAGEWPSMLLLCPVRSSKNPGFADGMTIMTYMDREQLAVWENTENTVSEPQGRGDHYARLKHAFEEKVLQKVETVHPDIRKHIRSVHSSTPLTFRDYLGSPDGSMYGILKDVNRLAEGTIHPRSKIENLYFTGQNVVFHGILGTTIAGYLTAFEFISPTHILNQITHENTI